MRKQTPTITFKEVPHDICFRIDSETPKEIIKITEGKFYWKGKEVKDIHKVYERFNEWLKLALKE